MKKKKITQRNKESRKNPLTKFQRKKTVIEKEWGSWKVQPSSFPSAVSTLFEGISSSPHPPPFPSTRRPSEMVVCAQQENDDEEMQ